MSVVGFGGGGCVIVVLLGVGYGCCWCLGVGGVVQNDKFFVVGGFRVCFGGGVVKVVRFGVYNVFSNVFGVFVVGWIFLLGLVGEFMFM